MSGRDEYCRRRCYAQSENSQGCSAECRQGRRARRLGAQIMSARCIRQKIDEADIGDELELRVMEWVAEEKGLI